MLLTLDVRGSPLPLPLRPPTLPASSLSPVRAMATTDDTAAAAVRQSSCTDEPRRECGWLAEVESERSEVATECENPGCDNARWRTSRPLARASAWACACVCVRAGVCVCVRARACAAGHSRLASSAGDVGLPLSTSTRTAPSATPPRDHGFPEIGDRLADTGGESSRLCDEVTRMGGRCVSLASTSSTHLPSTPLAADRLRGRSPARLRLLLWRLDTLVNEL